MLYFLIFGGFFLFILICSGILNWMALNDFKERPESFESAVNFLRENSLGGIYLNFLGWFLGGIGNFIGDRRSFADYSPPESVGFVNRVFGFNPFTAESYSLCLRLAFLYPIASFYFSWAIGGDAQVGNMWVLGNVGLDLVFWQRWQLLVIESVTLFFGLWLSIRCDLIRNQWLILFSISVFLGVTLSNGRGVEEILKFVLISSLASIVLFSIVYFPYFLISKLICESKKNSENTAYLVAFSVGAITSLAIIITPYITGNGSATTILAGTAVIYASIFLGGTSAIVITFAAAYMISRASNDMDAVLFISQGLVAFAIAGFFVVILEFFKNEFSIKNRKGIYFLIYTVLFVFLGYLAIALFQEDLVLQEVSEAPSNGDHLFMILVLLWLIIPLINAPLDWLSLGVTRGLLQSVRAGHHKGLIAVIWGIVDIFFALIALFLITAILIIMTNLGNFIVDYELVNMTKLLREVGDNPRSVDHWWLYSILLSTLVPTLAHFAIVGGATTLWLSRALRLKIVDNIEENHYKIGLAWAYLTFMPFIGFIIAPLLLLSFLYWFISEYGEWFGGTLLNFALWLT